MTQERQDLLEVIRDAIWGGTMPPISSELREELRVQTVEGLTQIGTSIYAYKPICANDKSSI